MKFANSNLLYYMAIGDAYGVGGECISEKHQNIAKLLGFKKYLSHPTHHSVPGKYSDDTQQSIANAETLITGKPYNELAWANSWVNVFKRDPRNGYSRNFQRFLETTNSGIEFLKNIYPISNKNGAAMRSLVLGVLKPPKDVLKFAKIQAAITHNTSGGIFGAQAVALMSHYALWSQSQMSRANLGEYIIRYLGHDLASHNIFKDVIVTPWNGRVSGDEMGIKTAWAVFELLVSSNSLLDILYKVIKFGGDIDSVGAIALGIGSARLKDDLPLFLHSDLEPNSKYGKVFLKNLGSKLISKFNK